MFGLKIVKSKEVDALKETLTRAERTLEDIGWINLSSADDSNALLSGGFRKAVSRSRLFFYNNPLAGHWCNLTTWFIFGEGISAPTANDEKVQEEIDNFWNNPDNQIALTGFQAQQLLSNKLQYEGNIFFMLFEDEEANIKIRILNTLDVEDVVTSSNDNMKPLFYKSKLIKKEFSFKSDSYASDLKGYVYYPDKDNIEIKKYGIPDNKLKGDVRIYHLKVNGDINDKFGVPDLYRGIDWMKAHKDMAGDLATLVKALSQFAWKKKIKGTAAQVSSIASAMNSKIDLSNLKNTAGRTQVENQALNLEGIKIPTGGVSIGKDGLRSMLLQVAAASGIMEHYFGDPSTGNLATAKSMELPMVKKFVTYQRLWASAFDIILQYLVDRKISKGMLPGSVSEDFKNERMVVEAHFDRHIDIDFPPILEADIKASAEAWTLAKNEGLVSQDLASERFMLDANINNIDEEMKKTEPEESIEEAIDIPKKEMNRLARKNNFLEQKLSSFKKSIVSNFRGLQKEIKESIKTSSLEDGRTTGTVRDVETIIFRFGEKMKLSARTFFPLAVEIGEKFMQAELRDVIPGINIAETIYESQGAADGVLGDRLRWNSEFVDNSLVPAISESVNGAMKQHYGSAAEYRQAVNHSVNKFEGRVSQYVGALWTVEEAAVKETGRDTGVLVNFAGPDDSVSCPGCEAAVAGNPWPINDVPLPGEQDCRGNCRHAIQVIQPGEEMI